MLDIQRLGVKINALRKKSGYSQEKLASMLNISPQAISKWENGHSLPETSLLPVLAQIFNCTIDDIIMPVYIFDEKKEQEKTSTDELQAERIANQILQKLKGMQMGKTIIGMDDESIVSAIRNTHPNIGNCEISRGTPSKIGRYTCINITVIAPQTEIKLIEKILPSKDKELYNYSVVADYTLKVPQIIYMDIDKGVLLMEDLNEDYVQGNQFNEDSESGAFIRENYNALLHAAAKYHAAFWDSYDAFKRIGLDWRLESQENLFAHVNGMEKDYKKYRTAEENGKIPKVWNIFENTIELSKLDYFQTAIDILRARYSGLIDTRFTPGKNLTVIHGDLHPGNMFISKTLKTVKFIDMEAVRMGICTEDLAMLIALHIAPNKKQALPLLKYYHNCLCETIKDYPFELLLSDYQISIMENMFFTIRLMNRGIYDFSMRDRAMKAFETFVL